MVLELGSVTHDRLPVVRVSVEADLFFGQEAFCCANGIADELLVDVAVLVPVLSVFDVDPDTIVVVEGTGVLKSVEGQVDLVIGSLLEVWIDIKVYICWGNTRCDSATVLYE